jgi:hypothetical protein
LIWGYAFQPGGSSVAVYQTRGANFWLPSASSQYWWNGNANQINTVAINNTGITQLTGITVWAYGGASQSVWFYVDP